MSDFYSTNELGRRGWSTAMIASMLGKSDTNALDPISNTRQGFYLQNRVHAMETTPEFKVASQAHDEHCKDETSLLVARRNALIDATRAIPLVFPKTSLAALKRDAIKAEPDCGIEWEQVVIERLIGEVFPTKEFERIAGKHEWRNEAYIDLTLVIIKQIANHYPDLTEACSIHIA